MTFYYKKPCSDQIWSCVTKENLINDTIKKTILQQNFIPNNYPFVYTKANTSISSRTVDSLFLHDPDSWNRQAPNLIITDNIVTRPLAGNISYLVPEFWHIYHCKFQYIDRPATWSYSCFLNRISGDRSIMFYELIRRNILDKGLVSFNCWMPGNNRAAADTYDYSIDNYNWQYTQAELQRYEREHHIGLNLIPYNNIQVELEQAIVDSNVSVILETYISDDHITFSEKIFRALQLPRPWLLYCSPRSVEYLQYYGFDVLDDYVDHSYDATLQHHQRLGKIIDQLSAFIDRRYTEKDYMRFNQAAIHNQTLLKQFIIKWPEKFNNVLEEIKQL